LVFGFFEQEATEGGQLEASMRKRMTA
jgi:hypothetical protein